MSQTEKYLLEVQSPLGKQESELFLTISGEQLEGKMVAGDGETAIEEGKVNGDELVWSVALSKPIPVTLEFTGQRSGDSITGEVKFGAFGNGPFTAQKA